MRQARQGVRRRSGGGAGGGGERVEQPQLALIGVAHASIDRRAGVVKRAGEPVSNPAACGSRSGEQQTAARVDRGELDLGEPDLEGRLADQPPQLAADPVPISEIAVARCSELLADRVDLDDDGALSFAAAVAEEVLNDRDRLGAAPPVRGVGGSCSSGSLVPSSRARWAPGFSASCAAGVAAARSGRAFRAGATRCRAGRGVPRSRGSASRHRFVFPRPPAQLSATSSPDASSAARARRYVRSDRPAALQISSVVTPRTSRSSLASAASVASSTRAGLPARV